MLLAFPGTDAKAKGHCMGSLESHLSKLSMYQADIDDPIIHTLVTSVSHLSAQFLRRMKLDETAFTQLSKQLRETRLDELEYYVSTWLATSTSIQRWSACSPYDRI